MCLGDVLAGDMPIGGVLARDMPIGGVLPGDMPFDVMCLVEPLLEMVVVMLCTCGGLPLGTLSPWPNPFEV